MERLTLSPWRDRHVTTSSSVSAELANWAPLAIAEVHAKLRIPRLRAKGKRIRQFLEVLNQ